MIIGIFGTRDVKNRRKRLCSIRPLFIIITVYTLFLIRTRL